MPIIYVHGVSIRDDREWDDLQLLLRRYVAPQIATDPGNVLISRCYWGEYGAKFRWSGGSAPTSPMRETLDKLVAQGTDKLNTAVEQSTQRTRAGLNTAAERSRSLVTKLRKMRLKDMNKETLSDVCTQLFAGANADQAGSQALGLIAADEIALDGSTHSLLQKCKTVDDELKLIEELLQKRYRKLRDQIKDTTANHKIPELTEKFTLNIEESLARSAQAAGYGLTRAAAAIRSPMNRFVTLFIGDVLTYIHERGNYKEPGWIPSKFLATLAEARENQKERAGEPLIVMSHSMGGQIVYDAVTHFLPKLPEYAGIRIDFWVASASQVGLFEELKLFLESCDEYSLESGLSVPYPDAHALGYWWNVWDHNDFISYSVQGIIDGVDDEAYNTGMFIVDAHGGYLVMPSFFRKFGKKLESAKLHEWRNPRLMNTRS